LLAVMAAMKTNRGFTVIELMVTLAILALMMGLGIPSFRAFISSQKIKSGTSELMTTLVLARSEAVKRNANVTITPTSATVWNAGWVTTAVIGGVATTLHTQDAITGITVTTYTNSTCTSAGDVASIVYSSTGRTAASSCYKFSGDSTSTTKCVKVDLTGIPTSGTCP
jgi:type IV fimbrial biogenesis protein FimT